MDARAWAAAWAFAALGAWLGFVTDLARVTIFLLWVQVGFCVLLAVTALGRKDGLPAASLVLAAAAFVAARLVRRPRLAAGAGAFLVVFGFGWLAATDRAPVSLAAVVAAPAILVAFLVATAAPPGLPRR
jgi:hypothetical protein